MRLKLLNFFSAVGCLLIISGKLSAQNCIPTNINGAVFNLLCNQVCSTLVFQIPHIKSSDDYTMVNVAYTPYPYTSAGGSEDFNLYQDDEYSFLIGLPFTFCFYGGLYTSTVVGSNGIMTFDPANASCANAWPITQPIPYAGGTICNAGTTYYPKASIMGAYSDLDPRTVASPANRKIQWEVIGNAPCRKFVVSYYRVGVYGNTCGFSTPNTFQMVIHESTGIVEIFTEQKACFSTTNAGRGIQGLQDFTRTKAKFDPAKNNTTWSENNTGVRFIPSAGTSRYVSCELLDMTGTVVATADTLTTVTGLLDMRFLNFCSPPGSTQYAVRTRFSACENPATILESLDTITINRTNSLNAFATTTPDQCGPPNGTITITVPPGIGTPPYTFVLDGVTTFTGASPHTFTNVAQGPHTVVVTDASNGCTSTINVNVFLSGNISITTSTVPTACFGSNTGKITINTASGIGPYTFSLDGGPFLAGTLPFTFNNVSSGNHTVIVDDLGTGCNSGSIIVNVPAGVGVTATTSSTPTACIGVNTGTITVTALTGVPPFTWSLDGGPAQAGANPYTFTNVSSGLHTITITDNLNCNVIVSQFVSNGPGVTASTASTPTGCPGATDGTITVTALSGTPPFTWSLDGGPAQNGASPYTFINVASGSHTITVTDNLGCNIIVSEFVNAGTALTATTSSTPAACATATNGSITITSASGTAPYTFTLDGGAPQAGTIPFTFNNVAPGNHTVIVTDNTGCSTLPMTVPVSAGPGVSGNAITAPTACATATNGSITVTATSGTAPFTWILDGGAPQNGASPYTFNNVAAGSHTVIITDNFGCTLTLNNVVVNAGAGVSGNATTTATTCPSAPDGSITVTATAGTAPFTWILDGGAPQNGASPYTFNNVAAGPHTVIITDNFGCTLTLNNVVVNAGPGVSGNATTTATTCPSAPDGSITVTATAGTAPFTWSLDGGPAQNGASPYTFNNVAAGSHTVVITDNFGCSLTLNNIIVTAGPGVTGSATTTATSCPTASNGSITVTATAGTAPFTWSLDGGPAQNGANPYTFNNVAAGPHTIVVTDNSGCTLTLNNVMVNPGPTLTANTTAMATSCSGASNGSITVTPVGGASPFSYVLDGGPAQIGPSPYTFNNLTAGNHTIVVSDAIGCVSNTITVNVPAGPMLTTTVATTDVLCNGGATGIITVAVPVIGNPPYQYSLDNINWQASNIFNGLLAGPYTVYYRENNGCQGSQPVTVAEPPVLTASSSTVPAVCNGQSNGTITITAGGGVSPYQYSIDGGANWQASNVFNVIAGSYTVTIRDINNCTTTRNVTVTEPLAITATSINTAASCNGGTDGTIVVTANGGNGGFQYSIDGINFQSSNTFNVVPGTYTVTVKDNMGCTTTFSATVPLGNNLTFTKQSDVTICEGTSTQLNFISNATVYSWSPSNGLSNTSIPNPVANPTVTTEYFVTATLGGCVVEDTVFVNVNPAPVPDAGPPGIICFGQTYQLQASGGVQYSWTPSTYLDNPSVSNPISSAAKTIIYTLSIISDNNGCASLVTDDVMVDVTPPIKVNTFPYDTIGYPGDLIQLQAISVVPAANIYTWTPSTNLNNPNIPNPVVTSGNVGDVMVYKVTAMSAAGCMGEGYVRFRVFKGPELYMPTAFTPNGDGLNETFYPFPVGIKSINYFKVFNRWGQLIFSSQTLYKGWDGKIGGVDQPTGVYVFMAEGVDKDNHVLTRRGNVTLIR